MQGREEKKHALLELIKRDPEAVVDILLDLMEDVELLVERVKVQELER